MKMKKFYEINRDNTEEINYCLQEIGQALKENPSQAIKEIMQAGLIIDRLVPYRDGHSLRVCNYALLIAQNLKLCKKEMIMIEVSAILHDIGKIGLDNSILLKPEKLTKSEKKEIEKHALIGYIILHSFIDTSQILDGVRYHHEFWDGTGYPHGLRNNEIPLISRVIAVADAFDAMTSYRPYRSIYSKNKAITELKKFASIQFDAKMVRIFLEVLNELEYSY
jgi:HD-GYP domain-containing protein (c-di-GMP phosphodiesterase class II)